MPDKASSEYRGEAAAAAFDRLLEAERAAEAAVELCRRRAADLLTEAREDQRTLGAEVERRLAAWRVRLAQQADAEVAALDREAARWAEPTELDAATRHRVALATARLASELIEGD